MDERPGESPAPKDLTQLQAELAAAEREEKRLQDLVKYNGQAGQLLIGLRDFAQRKVLDTKAEILELVRTSTFHKTT